MSTIIASASLAITRHVDDRLAELETAAHAARVACLAAIRAALAHGADQAPEAERLVQLAAAESVTVGRESDGYPDVKLSSDATELVMRAIAAGVLTEVSRNHYGPKAAIGATLYQGGLSNGSDLGTEAYAAWQADYAAWEALRTYRKAVKR